MRTFMLFFLVLCFVLVNVAPARGDAEAEPKPEEPIAHPTFDLGHFKINDLRPTRNEVAKLTFKMHLVVSPELSERQVAALENWEHRLRDQVHIAIRTMEIKEFQEPSLSLLRRKVLLRVNRLFQKQVFDEVLLTEYLFRTH